MTISWVLDYIVAVYHRVTKKYNLVPETPRTRDLVTWTEPSKQVAIDIMSFDDCNVHVNSPEVVPTAVERQIFLRI